MNNCLLCNNNLITKFIDKNYLIQYCEHCKLSIANQRTFIKICINKLNTLKYSSLAKQCIAEYLSKYFLNTEFGIVKKLETCQNNCGYLNGKDCFIYKYTFNNFEFYYCFHNNLIFFKEDNIEVLLECIDKVTLKLRIKIIFNNILTKIKNLFVKQIED